MGHALDYLEDELVELETNGLLLHPRTLEGPTGARATFDGREVINLASNNYLGLSNHPRMNRAAADAAERFGAGTGAVRTIAGQMRMHLDLEERFAAFKHADAALLFQSGFTANAGTVAAILGPDDVIVSDRLNHASIIDGARLSKAEIKVFEHRDAADAERLLAETAKPGRRQLLITDGVFSMDGDIAPLGDLVEVAERRDAIMMIDDAHASGVLGDGRRRDRGPLRVARSRRHPGRDALEGDRRARRVHRGPAAPDRVAAEPRPSVSVLDESAAPRRRRVRRGAPDHPRRARPAGATVDEHRRSSRTVCTSSGSTPDGSETPITPVITGDEAKTQAFARRLFEEGVFCPAIVFPTVGRGKARVRTIVTADHTEQDLAEALASFERVGKELGLLGG